MKILLLALSMAMTTALHAQESEDIKSKCSDNQAKCSSVTVNSCKEKCGDINDLIKQKMCFKKCSDRPHKPKPDSLVCKKKCLSVENPEKQKACLNSCVGKKPKKKIPAELSSCEKTNAQTITCADGVFVKSSSVTETEIIKEVIHKNDKSFINDSGASEQ